MNEPLLQNLLQKYLTETLSAEEMEQFRRLLKEDDSVPLLEKEFKELFDAQMKQEYALPEIDLRIQEYVMNHLRNTQKTTAQEPVVVKEYPALQGDSDRTAPFIQRVHFLRRWGWAAAVLLFLGATMYLWLQLPFKKDVVKEQPVSEIAPGTNKAILTLADGSQVTLDSAGNRVIRQGSTAIRQQGGQLQYNAQGAVTSMQYNILTTPRGGQFQVTLPDGSQAWLNAASSLRYPTAFTGPERVVEVTGEAYFEVVGIADKPFKVKIGEQAAVEVLGTRFNINAYTDEAVIKTTLLEGKVKVIKDLEATVLSPGEQAQVGHLAKIKVEKKADTEQALAWKNGIFNFDGAELPEVMRQIARWYDIEVFYEKGVPDIEFEGEMSRNEKLSDLLRGFERFDIHFRIEEGRRLIVTQ